MVVTAQQIRLVPQLELIDSNGRFYLDVVLLYDLQQYAANAIQLPNNFLEIGINNPNQDLDVNVKNVMENILNTYSRMEEHAEYWQDTFKLIAEVVEGINFYSQKAHMYYGLMKDSLTQLEKTVLLEENFANPSVQRLVSAFTNKANLLRNEAAENANKAKQVEVRLQKFLQDTESDKNQLIIWDNQLDDLLPETDRKIQYLMAEINRLQQEIQADENRLKVAVDKYNEIIYYAWVPFWGWIAAGVSAQQASQEIERVKANIQRNVHLLHNKFEELDKQHRSKAILRWNEAQIEQTIAQIKTQILPAIQNIYGGWKAMVDDLTDLKNWVAQQMLEPAIQQDFAIMDINLDIARDKWIDIGLQTQDYLRRMYGEFGYKSLIAA
jgi:DNA repair exonuclease SbcCD ATPase subunit